MTDTNDTTKKPSGAKTLTLKKTETSTVKQSFSHGRTKAVVVEKKRTLGPVAAKPSDKPQATPASAKTAAAATPAAAPRDAAPRAGVVLRQLTEEEKARRGAALADARVYEVEARKRAEEDARHRAVEEEKLAREREAAARRKAEEDARKAQEELARKHAEEEAARRDKKDDTASTAGAPARGRRAVEEEEEETTTKKGAKVAAKVPAAKKVGDDNRRRGKLTVTRALSGDDERTRSVAAYRRHLQRVNKTQQQQPAGPAGPREVTIPEAITVAELANRMARRSVDIIKVLMKNGHMATANDVIDADTAELVAAEYGHTVKRVAESDVLEGLKGAADSDEARAPRPPVVTVMGHVDHGKTSLLDALRKTDVVSGEAGGITQHIGAYQVTLKGGQKITFLDTPGHAAFTAMRSRGAKVTDLVVLVVAADDGVMPQTVEAIAHARAAHVPMVVAINKIDKPDAKPERVKNELLQQGIVLEEFGGDVLAVEVSAKQRTNLDKLLETIMLQSEVLELKANPDRAAQGVVVEAKMERGRGTVATVLVQRGTLNVGDILVAGGEWGRVRALLDDHGRKVKAADPGMPVEVLGLQGTPSAGDDFIEVDNEARAREITEFRQRKSREARVAAGARGTVEQM